MVGSPEHKGGPMNAYLVIGIIVILVGAALIIVIWADTRHKENLFDTPLPPDSQAKSPSGPAAPSEASAEANVKMIAEHLARIQAEGGKDNHVIFKADEQRDYYVQFAVARGQTKLHAEAVSNHYLPPKFALKDTQTARLVAEGWTLGKEGNYVRHWEARNDAERLAIAREVMRTLVEIYGLAPDVSIDTELQLDGPAGQ